VELLPDDAVDVLVPLDEDEVVEPEELETAVELDEPLEEPDEPEGLEELEDGAVGWNALLPVPKPIFEAKVPPTVIGSLVFFPAMTRSPLPLSQADTCALP